MGMNWSGVHMTVHGPFYPSRVHGGHELVRGLFITVSAHSTLPGSTAHATLQGSTALLPFCMAAPLSPFITSASHTSNGQVTDLGLRAVLRGCAGLLDLSLAWCEALTPRGLHYLHEMKALTRLNLSHCPVCPLPSNLCARVHVRAREREDFSLASSFRPCSLPFFLSTSLAPCLSLAPFLPSSVPPSNSIAPCLPTSRSGSSFRSKGTGALPSLPLFLHTPLSLVLGLRV